MLHFENVGICPTLKEYGLLTEFPQNLYKAYSIKDAKSANSIGLIDQSFKFYKILEKSATSLKWKMIKDVFESRKNDYRFVEEKR